MRRFVLILLFAALLFSGLNATQSRPGGGPTRWYKGNLHTHTLNSDGDSTPMEVATWYREHGYQFLVLTDHNFLTDIAGLNGTIGATEKFLLIRGEEVTDSFEKRPIHINAINLHQLLQPTHGASVAATIQSNVQAIRKARALPSLNHPNFHWAVNQNDMLAAEGLTHFEVYNGHPTVNNDGGGGAPSLDQMWDTLLTAGRRVYGVAVDDAHHFKKLGKEFSNPGHGWVWVRSNSLDPDQITEALDRGDFYSSTGVKLADVRITGDEYTIDIAQGDHEKTTTHFIGADGKILASSNDKSPRYRFTGRESYVRARIESSRGTKAWTQPVFRR